MKGMIYDVIVRHKVLEDKSFVRFLVPTPTVHDLKVVKQTLSMAYMIKEQMGEDFVNPMECFGYGPCYHLTSGACDRT